MKYRLIEAEKSEHRISRLCKVLGVTRQGYYAWRRRGPSLRQLGDDELAKLIVTIYDGSHQTYGAVRINDELRDEHELHVGRKRVARLMRRLEIQGVSRRGKKARTTIADEKAPPAPDLVERKFVAPFIGSAIVLFSCGAAFAYFVMPIGLGFLAGFLGGNAIYFPDIDQYLSFFLLLVVIFGVTFEMPVVLVLLGVLRIISSQWLRARRKVAIVLIIAAAAIVTPGADPFTPTFLAIPLILLYEGSILVLSRVFHR